MKIQAVWLICVALLVSLIGNYWQYSEAHDYQARPSYHPNDQRYVDLAVAAWADYTGASRISAMSSRYPRVIRFPNETCVSLNLTRGSAGGVPVYCFDTEMRVTRKYDQVE